MKLARADFVEPSCHTVRTASDHHLARRLSLDRLAETTGVQPRTPIRCLVALRSLLVLLLAPFLAARGQAVAPRLDAYLSARAKIGQFNGTVLVAQGGRVLLEKGYGLAEVANRVPASASTRYEIASISKMFTAAAILRLQEDGRLSTRDPICRYVERCPDSWRAITIAQLLHHTSGIPDYESALDPDTPAYLDYMLQSNSAQRILEHARTQPLDFPPGTKFHYSNTGYNLLADIIERVTQRPFRAFVRERVLAPAGLSGMTFVSRDAIIPRLASGYIRAVDSLPVLIGGITLDEHTLRPQAALPLDGPHGDGALVSDARSLWRWTEALADSTALAPASIRELMTPVLEGYAEGWIIGERFKRRTASHTGWLPGYVSMIEWYPESRTTIVVLSNVEGTRTSRVMRDLAAITFGEAYDIPVAHRVVPFDSAGSVPLAGRYLLTNGDTAVVSLGQDMLRVQIPKQFTAGALPLGGDAFYAPFFENLVRFQRGKDGRGASIVLQINGVPRSGVRQD